MLGVSSIASRIPRAGSMVMTNAVGKGGETSHDFHQGLHQDPASGSSSVALALAIVLVRLLSWLPPYRVLMVWVYDRTGSLLVAMLMSASWVVAWNSLRNSMTLSQTTIMAYYLVLAVVWWAIVAVIALANHGHLSRQPPLRRQVA
jgi:hypothetical protein